MKQIEDNKDYFGEMIHKWESKHENMYVITGHIQGKDSIAQNRVGRVAQVRLEAGDFGSDCVLLRHCDDTLTPHVNQSFWLIPDKFKEYLDECFEDTYMDEANNYEYTLSGKEPEKGFIIESKIKDGESTPMRDIKNAIYSKIDNIIND